jgi:hypothetical protein
MLSSVRKGYHWRAAQVLERGGTSGPLDEKIDLLAHHFLRAAEHEKALAYLARAIRRARQLCAYDVALDYVDQALSLVEELSQAATSHVAKTQRSKQKADLLEARAQLQETAPR